jgi:hypothetical protein
MRTSVPKVRIYQTLDFTGFMRFQRFEVRFCEMGGACNTQITRLICALGEDYLLMLAELKFYTYHIIVRKGATLSLSVRK